MAARTTSWRRLTKRTGNPLWRSRPSPNSVSVSKPGRRSGNSLARRRLPLRESSTGRGPNRAQLEHEFQRKLNNARPSGRAGDLAGPVRAQVVQRLAKIYVVECVKELGAELCLDALRNPEVLQ